MGNHVLACTHPFPTGTCSIECGVKQTTETIGIAYKLNYHTRRNKLIFLLRPSDNSYSNKVSMFDPPLFMVVNNAVDTAFCPYSIFVCFVKIKSLCLIKHTP
jgi:hypothetical protein